MTFVNRDVYCITQFECIYFITQLLECVLKFCHRQKRVISILVSTLKRFTSTASQFLFSLNLLLYLSACAAVTRNFTSVMFRVNLHKFPLFEIAFFPSLSLKCCYLISVFKEQVNNTF